MHLCRALDPTTVRSGTPCSVVTQLGNSPQLTNNNNNNNNNNTSTLVPLPRCRKSSISDTSAYYYSSLTLTHPPITHLRQSLGLARRRGVTSAPATMLPENPVAADICALAISGGVALFFLLLWEQTAKFGVFDQKLNRKLVHISIGLAFMLCWPLFSSGYQGILLASLIPGVNIIRMILLGLGIMKDEETVKSMSRFNDHRELLKGPLYYATMITLACVIYWRTSPVAIAMICNLCAGDGLADVVGRRFGTQKLPYNRNKSIAGSVAMASAGFLSSIGYMYYFSMFGYVDKSWGMALGFLAVSLASALVESLPISTDIDDNLTVPLTSLLVGTLIF